MKYLFLKTMNLYILIVFFASTAAFPFDISVNWPFNIQEAYTEKMEAFFKGQKNQAERAFTSSFEEAIRMKDSVFNYFEVKQRQMNEELNNYVESVKQSGRKIVDSWSFLPIEESGARMENPDMLLTVPSIISRNGYLCETHIVMSQGYLLNIHRIPRSKMGGSIPKKTIILHHGLFASSADWVLNGPGKSLAYLLSDAGYDVWMPNIRGNKYSREHAWFKTDSKSFWNFSWHDVAVHDVPAIIDHIIREKGEGTKITYIGHSMGTTILFAMLTMRPEYNHILAAGFALAPVVFLSDIKSPIKSLAKFASNVAYMEMLYGSYEFIPKNSILGKMTSSCDVNNIDSIVCKNLIFYICGYNEKQFNKTLLPIFLSNLGTGTSWKTAVHFAQEVIAGGNFQQFDYGMELNRRMYGNEAPPEYDLSKITLPLTLFWAANDLLSSETDVKHLYESLPSTTQIEKILDPDFNHLDYLWAIDAPTLLNNRVLHYLDQVYSSVWNDY